MGAMVECRVCGKLYEICVSCGPEDTGKTYNWRRVACSPECGDIYLQQIIESRMTPEEKAAKAKKPEEEAQKETTPTKKQSVKSKVLYGKKASKSKVD